MSDKSTKKILFDPVLERFTRIIIKLVESQEKRQLWRLLAAGVILSSNSDKFTASSVAVAGSRETILMFTAGVLLSLV